VNFIKLRFYVIGIIIVLMIVGCETQQFVKTEDNSDIYIHWPPEQRTWMAVRNNCPDEARACMRGHNLYAVDPIDAEDLEQFKVLGHEFLHGVYGSWHD